MILAVSTNRGDPTPHLQAEGARMAELVGSGLVQQVFLKADWSGSVLLADGDLDAVREAVDSLPLVREGITSFELTELDRPPG